MTNRPAYYISPTPGKLSTVTYTCIAWHEVLLPKRILCIISSQTMISNYTPAYLYTGDCVLSKFVIDAVIMGLLCTFGLIGNILSFVIFGMMGKYNASTVLFRALTVSDSLLLLCVIPVIVPTACAKYMAFSSAIIEKERIYAQRYLFPTAVFAQASTVSISVLLAINRYIAVCKPLLATMMCTINYARKQLCCVLLISLVVNSPRFFESVIETSDGHTRLYYKTWARQSWYLIFKWITYALFFFIIPFAIILILGLRMVLALRSAKMKPLRRHSQGDTSWDSVTRLVFVILLVFLICQAPSVMKTILDIILPDDAKRCGRFYFYFSNIANVLVIVNSAVNLLICVVFNTNFRKTLQITCRSKYLSICIEHG